MLELLMFEEFKEEMPIIFTGFCWQTMPRLGLGATCPTNTLHQAQCYSKWGKRFTQAIIPDILLSY